MPRQWGKFAGGDAVETHLSLARSLPLPLVLRALPIRVSWPRMRGVAADRLGREVWEGEVGPWSYFKKNTLFLFVSMH